MRLELPDSLKEMNLGQLVALSHIAELSFLQKDFTESQNAQYEKALGDILDLSTKYVRLLTKENLIKINKHLVGKLYVECLVLVPNLLNQQYEYHTKVLTTHQQRKFKLFNREIKHPFKVNKKVLSLGNPAKLPANIWTMLLDGVIRNIEKYPKEKPYLLWRQIPTILAATAWGRTESYYTKDLNNDPIVNFKRIGEVKEEIKTVDAITAIKATAFFLTSIEVFSIVENMQHLKRKFLIQSSKRVPVEKSIVKNMVGAAT